MAYLIKRADGGVSFCYETSVTAEQFMAKWSASADPAWLPATVEVVENSSIPKKDEFRNALGHDLNFDMAKCRGLHIERMRNARTAKLEQLDIDYMRADELGDTAEKKRIADEKQELRDVTSLPAIASAATPEELRAVWPECLR
jgi:hypothetical protein